MIDPFAAVRAELGLWRRKGMTLPLWWRDDDATAPTPELERLLNLAERFEAPVHLAVIPQPATAELAARLRHAPGVFVLPHGWMHRNNAPAGTNKAEFGAHRSAEMMAAEIRSGWERIGGLFGEQALPVFTPPWNRIGRGLRRHLPGVGLQAVSTYKPRKARFAAPGLLQVNTHVDPIAWRRDRSLVRPAILARRITSTLVGRRVGDLDNAEPFGLLTHHLVHDEPVWSFTEKFLEIMAESGVAGWTSPLAEVSPAAG